MAALAQTIISGCVGAGSNRELQKALSALCMICCFVVGVECLCFNGSCQARSSSCLEEGNCGSGFQCQQCPARGILAPRCTRIRPTNPLSHVKSLPFNRYTWLTTHNSYAVQGMKDVGGVPRLSPSNQQDSILGQLQNGVRGLMLDMYDFEDDIWLCHSYGGHCHNFTAYQRAIDVLIEIRDFMRSNPEEIITLFIEDYVKVPQGLSRLFFEAGLNEFWFPVTRMPKYGVGDWPTVSNMIKRNQRLVVFTSKMNKEDSEGIAYQWTYVVENQYGDEGMRKGVCHNRQESYPMMVSLSLILMNHFPSLADYTGSCQHNSAELMQMMRTCYEAASSRVPNFIAVDFYKRSDGGGAPEAVDQANRQHLCRCWDAAHCKVLSLLPTRTISYNLHGIFP
ncbi:PI-PLC X domain-containing protein At5g67130-like [Nymphaea colorata]|nr:PI-PLC X domain-containing protein At5g67130-like [Nymphaea colorata]